jgi:hypothetical protein
MADVTQSPLADSASQTGPGGEITPDSAKQTIEEKMREQQVRADEWNRRLSGQYESAKDASNAYKQLLQDTADRLRGTNVQPTMAERWGAIAKGLAAPASSGSFAQHFANAAGAGADLMAQGRQAELAKQDLIAKYGIEGAQQALQASQMGINQASSQENNAQNRVAQLATSQGNLNRTSPLPPGVESIDPATGNYRMYGGQVIAPMDYARSWNRQVATGKTEGKAWLVTMADGSQQIISTPPGTFGPPQIPGARSIVPAPAGSPQPAPQPQAPPGAAGARPAVPGAPGAAAVPPGAPPQAAAPHPAVAPPAIAAPTPAQHSDLYERVWTPPATDIPQSPLSDTNFMPIYAQIADKAFANIPKIDYGAGRSNKMGISLSGKNMAEEDKAYAENEIKNIPDRDDSASRNVFVAKQMLDSINSGNLHSGPGSEWSLPIREQMAAFGLITPDAVKDDEIFRKEARTLAASGLKTTFGGRITNMELDNQIRANPNLALTMPAMKQLLEMELEKDVMQLHQDAMFGAYHTQGGSSLQFRNWYRQYFDPYAASMANRSIAQAQARPQTAGGAAPTPEIHAPIVKLTPEQRAALIQQIKAKQAQSATAGAQ